MPIFNELFIYKFIPLFLLLGFAFREVPYEYVE